MTDLSPDQIQQAREIAQTVISYPYRVLTAEGTTLARAVLALTEQQSEPVNTREFSQALWNAWNDHGGDWFDTARELLSRYTITRKQKDSNDG